MIRFSQCVMRIDPADRLITTTFADGSSAPARPNYRAEDIQRAHDLGYDGDTWAMTLDHEPLHCLVGELRGFGRSVVLWNVAHGGKNYWPEHGREEEGFVMSLQRYVRTGEADDLVGGLFLRAEERCGLYPEQVRWLVLGLLAEVHKEDRMTDSPAIHRERLDETPGNPHRLGRHIELDPRSLSYTVAPVPTIKPMEWLAPIPTLDQGQVGSCTGNAGTRALAQLYGATGLESLKLNGKGLSGTDGGEDELFALELYHAATVADGYPGTYPPDDTGSSGLGVCKALAKAKLISKYQWATSLQAFGTLMQTGPAIIGMPWYQSFFSPDAHGFIDSGNWHKSGVAGGHEVYVEAIEAWGPHPADVVFRIHNSWADSWGDHGCFRMRGATYQALKKQIDIKGFVR